jgi:hypothetical protein
VDVLLTILTGRHIEEHGTGAEWRNTHTALVRKSEGKGTLGRRRYKWEDNITMDHKEMGARTWAKLI